MPVLGHRGYLRLQRELPDPLEISSNDLHAATSSLETSNNTIWSGDRVLLKSDLGLPLSLKEHTANKPSCPDGYGIYTGSKWLTSPRRRSPTKLYAGDTSSFYTKASDVGLFTEIELFAYRDQLDRLSFYTSLEQALRGDPAHRVPLYKVNFGTLEVAPLFPEHEWSIQGQLQQWTLNLAASEVDVTALGERFGDSVKSLVTGGGTLDFLVDRTAHPATADTTFLMQLLLMIEKGCKARAEFWMIDAREDNSDQLLPGDLYYESTITITRQAINTRAAEIIAGSLDFVTLQEIALRMGTN